MDATSCFMNVNVTAVESGLELGQLHEMPFYLKP